MGSGNIAVHYTLRLVKTESGTGYFSCFPEEDHDFDTGLRYARAHPNDEFMRKHLLRLINGWGRGALKQAIQAAVSSDLFLLALFFEACLLNAFFCSATWMRANSFPRWVPPVWLPAVQWRRQR